MGWISVWEQDVTQQLGVLGGAHGSHHTSLKHWKHQTHEGKWGNGQSHTVLYQIWYFKKHIRSKITRQIITGKRHRSCQSLCVYLHLLCQKKKKTLQTNSGAKTGLRMRSLSLPNGLSFQTPLSRDAGALVSPSYCYEFSIVTSRLHSCHKAGWMAHMAIDVTLCCLQGI